MACLNPVELFYYGQISSIDTMDIGLVNIFQKLLIHFCPAQEFFGIDDQLAIFIFA